MRTILVAVTMSATITLGGCGDDPVAVIFPKVGTYQQACGNDTCKVVVNEPNAMYVRIASGCEQTVALQPANTDGSRSGKITQTMRTRFPGESSVTVTPAKGEKDAVGLNLQMDGEVCPGMGDGFYKFVSSTPDP